MNISEYQNLIDSNLKTCLIPESLKTNKTTMKLNK